jgi:hypothetical protein
MDKIEFIQFKGKEILFLNFSNCCIEDWTKGIEEAKKIIKARPEKSLLILTDITNARFNEDISHIVKDFTAHNKPYVKASAVVGVVGLKKVLFETIMFFSKRKFHAFDTIEQAKEWLSTM